MKEEYTMENFFELIKTADLEQLYKLLTTIQNLLKGGYDEYVMEVIKTWNINNDKENIRNQLFFDLCLFENLSGTKYIKRIIDKSLEDHTLLNKDLVSIMSVIDTENVSTFSRMEKVIRFAIKKSWDNMSDENKEKIFPAITKRAPSITHYINYVNVYYKSLISEESEIAKIVRLGKR